MAKANTFQMNKIDGYLSKHHDCAICGEKSTHRAHYYPTFMNGDAEWAGDYCDQHKETNLKKVGKNEIPLRYDTEYKRLSLIK